MSRTQQAIHYILNTYPAPTQREAAEKFGITQTTLSKGLDRYQRKHGGSRPDGRKRAHHR
jgi:hypothetical protein